MEPKPESDNETPLQPDQTQNGPIDATQTAQATPAETAEPKPEESLETTSQEANQDNESLDEDGTDSLDDDVPEEKVVIDEAEQPKKKVRLGSLKGKKNIYVILFVVLLLIAGGFTAYSVMTGKKKPPVATIGNQTLSQDALDDLANSDATVGSSAQTLTVQSSAVFSGQVLTRGGLTVAGNIQSGGPIQAPSIVVAGTANLGATQVKGIQVDGDTTVQGTTNVRDLNVAGSSTFNGSITASRISVSTIVLSGNGSLQVPNHISFPGASPSRTINSGVLGSGGSASVGGSDTTGSITINTGSGPNSGCFLQLNFRRAFTNNPHVIISPVGSATGALDYYTIRSKSGFSVCTRNTPSGGTVYTFDYFVTN